MKNFAFSLCATAAVALSAPAWAQEAPITYFTAAHMVDVENAKVIDQPLIGVREGRIISIADRKTAQLPADAKLVDLGNKTLLPGLIDMHVHLDSLAEIGGYNGLQYTDSFWAMVAVKNARDMLNAGFTTVRNVGSSNRNDIGLKQAIESGYAAGPRIVPAGYALSLIHISEPTRH